MVEGQTPASDRKCKRAAKIWNIKLAEALQWIDGAMANNDTNSTFRFHPLRVMLCAAALSIAFPPIARPDAWDKKTVVSTNVPIEVPGKALPAGTYVFKMLDSPADRNIVQIFDKDEKHLLATVLTVPDYRLKPADKPLLQFEERPSGTPEALKAWFYPGENYGREFVYPHRRAAELAKQNHQSVLSMRDEMSRNLKTSSSSATSSDIQALQKTEVSGVGPGGEPVEIDVVVSSKPRQ
jgi:hypothetical protein